MVTMLLCVPLAWRLMLPDDLENFGQSLVATTAFANNVLLMLTSGYFELATDFKPLVHTWTLGVEEQYYLIVPLLLAGLFRWGGRRATIIAIAPSPRRVSASRSIARDMRRPRDSICFPRARGNSAPGRSSRCSPNRPTEARRLPRSAWW